MYVWENDQKWKGTHNQDVVEEVFFDKCEGRGYAHRVIFAGISTGYKDSNNEFIYTGDVIRIVDGNEVAELALEEFDDSYRFILDNHSLLLSDCKNKIMTRIGTVFYQLNHNENPKTLKGRTMDFNGWYDTEDEHLLKVLMAKFTPNFEQEVWKYQRLEIIGAEYNWNK